MQVKAIEHFKKVNELCISCHETSSYDLREQKLHEMLALNPVIGHMMLYYYFTDLMEENTNQKEADFFSKREYHLTSALEVHVSNAAHFQLLIAGYKVFLEEIAQRKDHDIRLWLKSKIKIYYAVVLEYFLTG